MSSITDGTQGRRGVDICGGTDTKQSRGNAAESLLHCSVCVWGGKGKGLALFDDVIVLRL